MCGPLALALPSGGASRPRFLAGRFTYNVGRIATYSLLGLIFGVMGRSLALAGIQRWVSITLGVAVVAGVIASRARSLPKFANLAIGLVVRVKSSMALLLQRRSLASLGILGLLNGLLPCGLVYVACAGAMATGEIFGAMTYMAVFGLGTLPIMLTISVSGRLMPFSLRLKLQNAIPGCVFLVGIVLILRGMSLGIPYLSPDLTSGSPCCGK
jgi:sulfite exporter TauE/SafE